MTQVFTTQVSYKVGNRLGFKSKSRQGLYDDLKAACAKMGRIDLYHVVISRRFPFPMLVRLCFMSRNVLWGNLPLAKFEHYVQSLDRRRDLVVVGEHIDQKRMQHNNARYERVAKRTGRANEASKSYHAQAVDAALALPDLFPDE